MNSAYQLGVEAFRNGEHCTDCPFTEPNEVGKRARWVAGWNDAWIESQLVAIGEQV